jgi:two-component sensor histidine kinase
MRLDLRSIVFDNFLLNTMVSIILGSFAATARPRRAELALWASAYACLVAASISLALRGYIPPFYSIVLGNVAIYAFFLLVIAGIRRFRGEAPRWILSAAFLLAGFAWNAYFSLLRPALMPRFFFYTVITAALSGYAAFLLAWKPREGVAFASRISALPLALICLLSLLRIACAFGGLPAEIMAAKPWDIAIQAANGVLVSVLAFTLLLLHSARLTEELASSARERELLLRKMAHRTKNDLALVDSLISLEQRSYERALAAGEGREPRLDALRERIRCMAEAHDRLSKSETPGTVRLDEYLDAIADGLPLPPGIEIERGFAPVSAPFAYAAPLGLLMNELATNAIKHAFPEGGPGRIRLGLRLLAGASGAPGAALSLEVADDGVGTAWPPEKPGLGSMIAEAFARQLGGSLACSREGGSAFRLDFELPPAE